MPVTELYAFNLTCVILLMALYGVALNIHSPVSLYKAFPSEEARRLAERFEWHYTPKHGSCLDIAEIEIGIMRRQALGNPLQDLENFKQQVRT